MLTNGRSPRYRLPGDGPKLVRRRRAPATRRARRASAARGHHPRPACRHGPAGRRGQIPGCGHLYAGRVLPRRAAGQGRGPGLLEESGGREARAQQVRDPRRPSLTLEPGRRVACGGLRKKEKKTALGADSFTSNVSVVYLSSDLLSTMQAVAQI